MTNSIKKFFIICFFSQLLSNMSPAQDGIRFEKGSWKEILGKAHSEKKLVFVDVYTEWCGPCKQMVNEIFPKKSVGNIFNSSFINYKIDAEKGEGVEIAKSYSVKSYPTYLFVNGDGVLFYRSMGSMSDDKFLNEAHYALNEFNDPQPFAIIKSQYESNKNNLEFLHNYIIKCRSKKISCSDEIDNFVNLSNQGDILNFNILSDLLKTERINTDGTFFMFLNKNKVEISRLLGHSDLTEIQKILAQFANIDIDRAIKLKDETLLAKILNILVEINSCSISPDSIINDAMMKHYAKSSNLEFFTKIKTINDSPLFQRVFDLRKYLSSNFDSQMNDVMIKLQELNIDWSKNPNLESLSDDIRKKVMDYRAQTKEIAESKRDFIISFINDNNTDQCSILLLFELSKSPFPFAKAEEMWTELFSKLSEEVKRSQIGQFYKSILDKKEQKVVMSKSVSFGNSFKDFTLTDMNGNDVKMSSCLKDKKYILLDFWASWCGPCRAENPNVLKVFDKYREKGFDVVAVSLDKSKEAWVKAIADDKMPWTQLSDLKGWMSDVVASYGISGIPANFLIDENGTIIATDLRGENLDKKISELLK